MDVKWFVLKKMLKARHKRGEGLSYKQLKLIGEAKRPYKPLLGADLTSFEVKLAEYRQIGEKFDRLEKLKKKGRVWQSKRLLDVE